MNRDEHLQHLARELKALGYGARQAAGTPSEGPYLEVLEGDDEEPLQRPLAVTPFPDDEDYASRMVQFYFDHPLAIDESQVRRLLETITHVNRQLPVGHFGVSADNPVITYRYVLCVPGETGITRDVLVDVMDLVLYVIESSGPIFSEFA